MVFIGKDLIHEVIQYTLDKCLMTEEEMGFGLDTLQRQYPARNLSIQYPSITYFFPGQEDEDTVKGNYLKRKSLNLLLTKINWLLAMMLVLASFIIILAAP